MPRAEPITVAQGLEMQTVFSQSCEGAGLGTIRQRQAGVEGGVVSQGKVGFLGSQAEE